MVIADVMPHALARPRRRGALVVVPRAPARYRYGPATVKVDWALDGPIPWQAPEPREAGTVHVAGSDDELVRTIADSRFGLPGWPFLLLGQQSLADPSRAPAGKHTAWAYTHGPRTGIDWAGELAPTVERIEAQVERFAPGFRELILARHVMGPAELERRDRNLVGGDVGGGSYRLQQVIFRPAPGLSPYRTPLAGSTSAAPRRSPEAPSTAFPETPPPRPRSPTRGASAALSGRPPVRFLTAPSALGARLGNGTRPDRARPRPPRRQPAAATIEKPRRGGVFP